VEKHAIMPHFLKPTFATVRLLLNAGCDPNAIVQIGNEPLRLLAQLERFLYSDLKIISGLMLDFGAQLSRKNADGKTAVTLWILDRRKQR